MKADDYYKYSVVLVLVHLLFFILVQFVLLVHSYQFALYRNSQAHLLVVQVPSKTNHEMSTQGAL